MTTTNISLGSLLDRAADLNLNSKVPAVSVQDRPRILLITKYNMMNAAFNASTVLLVISAVLALFGSVHMTLFFSAIALLSRSALTREFHDWSAPSADEGEQQTQHVLNYLAGRSAPNAAQNILRKLQMDEGQTWNPDRLVICGYVVWKNYAPAIVALPVAQPVMAAAQ